MFLPILKIRNFYKSSIITVLLFMKFVTNGAAIKCFVCDSSDNKSCANLKSNASIVAEECTLDKMKSIDTWLFELNKFAYFDTGANKSPLMNCQKVVARDPNTNKMVTARFCQLNTGDSDACAILQAKLRSSSEDKTQTMQNTNNNNYNNNGRRGGKQTATDVEEQFHCSICTTDSCNGVTSFKVNRLWGVASISLFTLLNKINWQKRLSEFC